MINFFNHSAEDQALTQHQSRSRKVRVAVFAGILLAPAMTAVGTGAQSASAWCAGKNKPKNIDGKNNLGEVFGHEQPSTGTCNDNGQYEGGIYDMLDDDHCVYIAVNIDGEWKRKYSRSCHSYGTSYNFTDANHFSPTYVRRDDGAFLSPQKKSDDF